MRRVSASEVIERVSNCLNGSTGNEEPLVDATINRSRGKVLALRDLGKLALVDTFWRDLVGDIGTEFQVSLPHVEVEKY
jgi:hypothetical protein